MILFSIFDALKSCRKNLVDSWQKEKFWCIFDCVIVAGILAVLIYL